MQSRQRKAVFPLWFFFLITNVLFITGGPFLKRIGADQNALIIGNAVLFVITIGSFLITKRGFNTTNQHKFLRGVYGGIMIKLFLCMIGAFIYIAMYKSEVNKPALFTLMGLYLVYTFIEISALTKLLKAPVNG
jgi:hypothetical protein